MRPIIYKFDHWLPKLLRVTAITIYPYVLFSIASNEVTGSLLRHENMHVDQVRRVGWLQFYSSYLLYYLAGLAAGVGHDEAYRSIPYEAEARLVE